MWKCRTFWIIRNVVCFNKICKKFEEIWKFLLKILKVIQKNLKVLQNFKNLTKLWIFSWYQGSLQAEAWGVSILCKFFGVLGEGTFPLFHGGATGAVYFSVHWAHYIALTVPIHYTSIQIVNCFIQYTYLLLNVL